MRSFKQGRFLWQCYLDCCRTPGNKVSEFTFTDALEWFVDLCWVDISLNDVQDADEASFLDCSWNHDVLGLKKPSHNIKNCSFTNGWCSLVNSERSVASHQKVTARGWNQGWNQTHHVVVHKSWVSKSCCWGGHDCWYNGIDLLKCGMKQFQSVDCYSIQSFIIEHNHWVCIQSQSFKRKKAVIGLDDNIIAVWEYWVCLNDLFRIMIIESFKQVRPKSTSSSTSNRMTQLKSFQRIASISLSINHLKNFVLNKFSLAISFTPVISCTSPMFCDINILGVEQIWIHWLHDHIDNPWL